MQLTGIVLCMLAIVWVSFCRERCLALDECTADSRTCNNAGTSKPAKPTAQKPAKPTSKKPVKPTAATGALKAPYHGVEWNNASGWTHSCETDAV